MVVIGALILEAFAAAYLCDDVLRDPSFNAKKTQIGMDQCCGAKIGAVLRVWFFVIFLIGLSSVPATLFGVGVACWDRNMDHCGSNTRLGGQIMTMVGGILCWALGGVIFASKQLFDGDGTTISDPTKMRTARDIENAGSQSIGAFRPSSSSQGYMSPNQLRAGGGVDRLEATVASGLSTATGNRSAGKSKFCYFLIGCLKFALLAGGVAMVVFGALCDENENRFCGFGDGMRNAVMITLGVFFAFAVCVDVFTTGMDRGGGVVGIVGLVGIGMVIASPLLIGFGAACSMGNDTYCGSGGSDGGAIMIGVGVIVAAWAAAFVVSMQLNKQTADAGGGDVGMNFFMSIFVMIIMLVLFAPLALTGVGIKCLIGGTDQKTWCMTNNDSENTWSGILMLCLGIFLFFVEWLVFYYCRPRDEPTPPEPPATPDYPTSMTPPLYAGPPPPETQDYKRLGPFLAWSKWWGGPSSGGAHEEGGQATGHQRVDTVYRPGHWSQGATGSNQPRNVGGPVAIADVEEILAPNSPGKAFRDRDATAKNANLDEVAIRLEKMKKKKGQGSFIR